MKTQTINKHALYESIMKSVSKTVKQALNEAHYNDTNKDTERFNSIINRSNRNELKMCLYAFNMAKSIKNPEKLESRYNTALSMFGKDHPITAAFNAILNGKLIPGKYIWIPERIMSMCHKKNKEYVINKHKMDNEWFIVYDGNWEYSPETIFSDDYSELPVYEILEEYIDGPYSNGKYTYAQIDDVFENLLLDNPVVTDYVSGDYRMTAQLLVTDYDIDPEEIINDRSIPVSIRKQVKNI